MYISFFSPYLSTLGWSESLKGWFFSSFSIVGIFAAPFLGILSDKIGRYKVIIAGILLEILSDVGYAFVSNTALLFVLRIVSSIAFNAVVISALSRINDVVTNDDERTKTTGLFTSVLGLAVIVAPLIGGFIADNYGYQAVFKMAVVTMMVILVGFLVFDVFFYSDNHPHRKKDRLAKRDFNLLKNFRDFFKVPELRTIGIVGFFANMTVPFGVLLLPTLIVDRMGLSNSHLAIAIFVMSFASIFQYFFGSWVDSWSHHSKYNGKGIGILFGLSVNALFLALMYFAPSFEFLIAFIFLRSIGMSFWTVSGWAYMSDVGEKYNVEGKVVGTYSSISRIAITLSFIGTGYLLMVFSQQVFLVYALLVFLPLPFFAKKLLKKIKPTSWEK